MKTITLSETAVALLRFRIQGYRMPVSDRDLTAYRELVEAGIMAPSPGSELDYRFTEFGLEHREEILEREWDRIERERFDPPDFTQLSERARDLLRRRLAGDDRVTEANRPAYRELAEARIMFPVHTFLGGREAAFRFTYWGWHRRFEFAGMDNVTLEA